jgi:hypothetical protein
MAKMAGRLSVVAAAAPVLTSESFKIPPKSKFMRLPRCKKQPTCSKRVRGYSVALEV